MARALIRLKAMASPFDSPQAFDSQAFDAHQRGVAWMLSATAAAVVIAAWLVLLAHLLLIVRAEFRLAQVVQDANAFAELPQVTRSELLGYTGRQLQKHGFKNGKIRLAPAPSRTRKLTVQSVQAEPGGTVVTATQRVVGLLLSEPTVVQHPQPPNKHRFLSGED